MTRRIAASIGYLAAWVGSPGPSAVGRQFMMSLRLAAVAAVAGLALACAGPPEPTPPSPSVVHVIQALDQLRAKIALFDRHAGDHPAFAIEVYHEALDLARAEKVWLSTADLDAALAARYFSLLDGFSGNYIDQMDSTDQRWHARILVPQLTDAIARTRAAASG